MSMRRTVTITGHPENRFAPPPRPRVVEIQRRRPRPRVAARLGPRPDKLAMWAVLMALFLILVTVASSHGLG
jgi:hypothetical protein